MTKPVLLIGQAPSRSAKPGDPAFIGTDSGRRFCRLMNLTEEEVWSFTDTTNLILKYPGENGKWDKFDSPTALLGVERIKQELRHTPRKLVILAGLKVAQTWLSAMPATLPLHITYVNEHLDQKMLIIPHPGGTNVWYNNPQHRIKVAFALTKVAKEFSSA